AQENDVVARKVLDEAVEAFIQALNNLNMVFHFDIVTIAGTTIDNNYYFINRLKSSLVKAPFRIEVETNHISKASKGMSYKILLNMLS
ncbi:MAG: ROK family protein, partial [Spirochaetales bacterium]|nr:ROK family protein [Spirochaetales bacterium]